MPGSSACSKDVVLVGAVQSYSIVLLVIVGESSGFRNQYLTWRLNVIYLGVSTQRLSRVLAHEPIETRQGFEEAL